MSNVLEQLVATQGNIVKYDKENNPSIFKPFPKMKSSDLSELLPDHVHPAFRTNGKEQSAILLGQFMASQLENDSTKPLYSLPNMPPRVSLGHDPFLARMRAFGGGVSGMTIADHGFLLLLAAKHGWVPKGNNSYGVDYRDGTTWESGKDVTVGAKRVFRGWEYECLIAHTTTTELLPSEAPLHWKPTGKHLGGTPVESQLVSDNQYRGYNTLTASGPLSWYLGGDPNNLCDIQGNAFEQVYGFRLVRCEIQIIPDNDAADPDADVSATSAAWRAILPHKSDDGFDLVEPGTAGTVHYTWQNGKITLDTVEPEFDGESRGTSFASIAVNTTNLPYVPYILYELGLCPLPGSTTQGYFYVTMTESERVARRGGGYTGTGGAGLGYLDCDYDRGRASVAYGGRPRSLAEPLDSDT